MTDENVASLEWHQERVDHWLTIWSAFERRSESGSIHPLVKIEMLHDGATFSGAQPEPAWLRRVDKELVSAPPDLRKFVTTWYFGRGTVEQKASLLRVSPATLYIRRKSYLGYLYGRFVEYVGDFP